MELVFIIIGWIILAGLVAVLVFAFRDKINARRPVFVALILSGMLVILMAVVSGITLTAGPRLDVSVPVKNDPYLEIAYISVNVTNNGNKTAENCVGEIVVEGLKKEAVKVLWGDGTARKNILPYGGSERLYFLIADPEKVPDRIGLYYQTAFKPPRSDDPWLLNAGDYVLHLTVRCENGKPDKVNMDLHIGQTWNDIYCNVK